MFEMLAFPLGPGYYDLFVKFLLIVCEVLIISNDFNNSILSLFFCYKICLVTRKLGVIPEVLRRLGDVMINLKNFPLARICLEKALEFSFYLKDQVVELKIYEGFGKLYFEENMVGHSIHYHNR